jgi:hypothetical protein
MSPPKTFNLLALGHRNVGKTVFLAGSYAASRPSFDLSQTWQLWFDCDNITAQRNLEDMLRSVACTGKYPPPTVKVTQFSFRLQRRSLLGTQTLCHFRWCDIPGERCNIHDPSFQQILFNSHGCCLFIDAKALVKHGSDYLDTLESFVNKAEAISVHVSQRSCPYPFALILTKCDALEPGPHSLLKLEQNLKPLLARLDAVQAKYRTFFSAIPIAPSEGMACLKPSHTAMPFLWLTAELRALYRSQPPQPLASGFQELSYTSSEPKSPTRTEAQRWPQLLSRRAAALQVVTVSLLGGIVVFWGLVLFGQVRLTPKRNNPQTTEVHLHLMVGSEHRLVVF